MKITSFSTYSYFSLLLSIPLKNIGEAIIIGERVVRNKAFYKMKEKCCNLLQSC